MSDRKKDTPRDDVVAFDNCMEVVADASILELTTDVDRVKPTSSAVTTSAVTTPRPADVDRAKDDEGRCKAMWRRVYRLLSSSVGLILLLIIYTIVGAAILHHTEYDREVEMHAELDAVQRRVVADIVNLTTSESRSRDGRVKSRDVSDVTLAAAVEALVVEYGDARQSLNPSSKSPAWTFSGALFFCGTVYTTIGQ